MARWPHLDQDAVRDANRKQADDPRRRDGPRPGGNRPGPRRPAGRGHAGPTVVVLPGPPRELQPMWETALQTDALRAVLAGAGELRQADRAPVRHPGVGDRRLAASRSRPRGSISRRARDHHLPAPRRDRGRHRFAPDAEGDYDALRGGACPSATATRCSPATARRSTSRSPRCCSARRRGRRHRGVVHRRADRRSADRAGGLVGLRARRADRLLQRGQDGARGRRPGADRARHGAVSVEVAEALADGARDAPRRRLRHRHHGRRRAGRRHGGQAGRHRLPIASPGRGRADHRAACSCPAAAATCATAPRPSRCTCCGACCSAWRARVGAPAARPVGSVAGELPEAARGACGAPRRRWRSRAAAVPDAALHVTLAFLGERPEDEVDPCGGGGARRARRRGWARLGEGCSRRAASAGRRRGRARPRRRAAALQARVADAVGASRAPPLSRARDRRAAGPRGAAPRRAAGRRAGGRSSRSSRWRSCAPTWGPARPGTRPSCGCA